MGDVLGLLTSKDILAFSQNYGIKRGYKGDTLFPGLKTANLEAEYYNLSQGNALPTVAKVHALDTEANIGQRPTITKINVEKFLIKEKLNQSEKVRERLNSGVDKSGLVRFVYDDLNNLGNAVVARTELMKQQLLATGNIVINENNISMTLDAGVPNANKVSYDWGSPEHDILNDIQTMVDIAASHGQIVNKVQTSRKIVRYMQKNKYVQAAIKGTLGVGVLVTESLINTLMETMYGFTIDVDEEQYATLAENNGIITRSTARFFPENKFTMMTTFNGALGTGLWGVTPEEISAGDWVTKSASQFVTFTQWETKDPVALWSKASGMFVPVLPNPEGVVIATIAFDGNEGALDSLTVTSQAGTASGDTAISVSPSLASGNSYRYKVATDAKLPAYGQDLRTWASWDGSSDITAATGKEICVAEVDAYYKAVKAGIATVTAHA